MRRASTLKVLAQDGEIWVLVLPRAPKCQLDDPGSRAFSRQPPKSESSLLKIKALPRCFSGGEGCNFSGIVQGRLAKKERGKTSSLLQQEVAKHPVRSRPGTPHANGLSACSPANPPAYLAGSGDLFGTAPKLRRITARRPLTFPAGARPEAARDEEKKPTTHGEALPNLGRQDQFGRALNSPRLGPPLSCSGQPVFPLRLLFVTQPAPWSCAPFLPFEILPFSGKVGSC